MKHKNSHLLVGYWSRLRKGRDVPDQTDIDPRAIKRLLSYTFILDCENPARPLYRLAGTGLCERFGFELKGTSFLGHWESQSSLALSPLLFTPNVTAALVAAAPIGLMGGVASAAYVDLLIRSCPNRRVGLYRKNSALAQVRVLSSWSPHPPSYRHITRRGDSHRHRDG